MPADGSFPVDYDHALYRDAHTLDGAREALGVLFGDGIAGSVLDIGCGTGTWLRAALDLGATDVLGVEGADVPRDLLLVPQDRVRRADLNRPLDLGRRFDLVICLEVAEHLEPPSAETLVDTLTAHGDRILFSGAAPGQPGTHHVNCQWPAWWQAQFNARGYACDDEARWRIWDNAGIEPWYRQNIMTAVRDQASAGKEPRIRPVLHPELVEQSAQRFLDENAAAIEQGALPWRWYVLAPFKAVAAKLRRRAG